MSEKRTLILNAEDIAQKAKRIAYEIVEQNYDEKEIVLIGLKPGGLELAKRLHQNLKAITKIKVSLLEITIDKKVPNKLEETLDGKAVNKKPVILVDDVANTGRTLCYALAPLLEYLPKSIQVAVMVDRQHKSFPISADYVGLSLSTTMKEHVDVVLEDKEEAVYLS